MDIPAATTRVIPALVLQPDRPTDATRRNGGTRRAHFQGSPCPPSLPLLCSGTGNAPALPSGLWETNNNNRPPARGKPTNRRARPNRASIPTPWRVCVPSVATRSGDALETPAPGAMSASRPPGPTTRWPRPSASTGQPRSVDTTRHGGDSPSGPELYSRGAPTAADATTSPPTTRPPRGPAVPPVVLSGSPTWRSCADSVTPSAARLVVLASLTDLTGSMHDYAVHMHTVYAWAYAYTHHGDVGASLRLSTPPLLAKCRYDQAKQQFRA